MRNIRLVEIDARASQTPQFNRFFSCIVSIKLLFKAPRLLLATTINGRVRILVFTLASFGLYSFKTFSSLSLACLLNVRELNTEATIMTFERLTDLAVRIAM